MMSVSFILSYFVLFILTILVEREQALLITPPGVDPTPTSTLVTGQIGDGGSKEEKPTIKCRVGRKDEFKIKLVNVTEGDGHVEVKSHDRLEFRCEALYPTRWVVSPHVEKMLVGVPVMTRVVEDIFDPKTFIFQSKMFLSVQENLSGSVTCQSARNSSVQSRIHIFIPEGNYFVGETDKIEVPGENDQLIPCPSNYPSNNPPAKLFQVLKDEEGVEYTKLVKGVYDPQLGFHVKENRNRTEGFLTGEETFRCVAGSSEVTVQFRQPNENDTIEGDVTGMIKPNDVLREYGDPGLIWPASSGQVICENKAHAPAIQTIQSISCESPYDCDLFRPCFTNPEDCPERISKGTGCHFGACSILKESQYSGLIKCTAGRNETVQYFFTGLDRRRYTLSDSVPKRALIQLNMDTSKPILYTNERFFFYCQASSFLFAQDLQFAAMYQNNTRAPLTSGSYKLANWEELESRESRGSIQQGIYVNLTKDMTAIICMAPWFNSSDWLETSTEFIARDPLAPSIDKSSADRVFYRGESNRNLFCSAVGEPKPLIKWHFNGTEISGNETTEENFAIIPTDEGGSILTFPRIQDSLQGIYSCEASNKFGNDTFDFRVQVHERKLLNGGAIYGLSIGGSIGLLVLTIALALMWRQYIITRNKLRNLTIKEIEEFVHGNPEALQCNPNYDSIPAESLPFDPKWEILERDIQIYTSEILGSGEFGLVVRGQLQGQPVAVKTTKANADVTYFKALLSELKVMAYIGKHANIVHFLGAVTFLVGQRQARDFEHEFPMYRAVKIRPFSKLQFNSI